MTRVSDGCAGCQRHNTSCRFGTPQAANAVPFIHREVQATDSAVRKLVPRLDRTYNTADTSELYLHP
jgi:hypothetical protein